MLAQLKSVEAERDALLKPASDEAASPATMLVQLKGIGPETAAILWSEGLFRRFDNRRQLAAYAGLAPTPWKSGSIDHDKTMQLLGVAIVYPEPGRYTASNRPAQYEVALDNDRVRAWRLKLNPGESAPSIQQTAPGARFVVAGGTVVEKRTGKPDQPLVLKNHDFMSMPIEERGIENIGNNPVELVEIELK